MNQGLKWLWPIIGLIIIVAALTRLIGNSEDAAPGIDRPPPPPLASDSASPLQQPKDSSDRAASTAPDIGAGLRAFDEAESDAKRQAMLNEKPWLRKWVLKSRAGIAPIDLVARIVDQDGDPVVGALVSYKVGGSVLATGSGPGRTVTDEDGFFEIAGQHGGHLQIESIEKAGYEFALERQANLLFGYQRYPDAIVTQDYTAERPLVYQAWRQDTGSTSMALRQYGGFFSMKTDGRQYSLDLTAPKGQRKTEGAGPGQIRVRMTRTDTTGSWRESEWDVAIEAVQGGLVEAQGLFSNVAPDGGYVNRIDVSSRDTGKWQDETEKHFFYREAAGGPHGRFTVKLRPLFRETEGRIRVDYVVNTGGTKELSTFTGYYE